MTSDVIIIWRWYESGDFIILECYNLETENPELETADLEFKTI